MDENKQNEYHNLIAQYRVQTWSLVKLCNGHGVPVEDVYTDGSGARYVALDVANLINNAISHKLIQLKEKIDECEDDIIKDF